MRSMIALAMYLGVASSALAFDYDEAVLGDLSSDPAAPTSIDFNLGGNTITGDISPRAPGVTSGLPVDPDFFWVTIDPGQTLTSIILDSFESGDAAGAAQAFMAVQVGTTVDVTGAELLAGSTFGAGTAGVGTDILDDLAAGNQVGGFTAPLGPGTYSFWIQETSGPLDTSYSMTFNVVPEPGTGAMLVFFALPTLGSWLRRRAV